MRYFGGSFCRDILPRVAGFKLFYYCGTRLTGNTVVKLHVSRISRDIMRIIVCRVLILYASAKAIVVIRVRLTSFGYSVEKGLVD